MTNAIASIDILPHSPSVGRCIDDGLQGIEP